MVLKRLFYHSNDFLKHTIEEEVFDEITDSKNVYKG